MRTAICVTTAGWVLLTVCVVGGDTVRGCRLPPRVVRAAFDSGGARYEWITVCDRAPVVIRASYNDRTNRATEVVTFPSQDGATNSFDMRCPRNPWAPGGRARCTQLRAVVNVPSAFTEPWLGNGVLRPPSGARPGHPNVARPSSPKPLLPPSGVELVSGGGHTAGRVELRWASSAGPAARYRVELQRSITAGGPFSQAYELDVDGTPDLSTGCIIPGSVLTTDTHRFWRWRVGRTADGRTSSYSAWQRLSFK